MSDVLRFVVERAYEQLLGAGLCNEWEISKAGEYLEKKFRIELNPQGKGLKNLQHNLILESREKEKGLNYREPEKAECFNRVEVRQEDVELAKNIVKGKMEEMARISNFEPRAGDDQLVHKREILPQFQNSDGSVNWDAVRAAKIKAQAEYDARLENKKMQDKIRSKLEKQKIRLEVEKSRIELSECELNKKLEEIKASAGNEIGGGGSKNEMIRSKSEKEIEEDYERIRGKDKALMDALNAPAPMPTVD
jgi:hypothetical protein